MPRAPGWEGRRPRDPRQFDAGTATPSLRADLALLRRLLSLARPFWPYLAGILLVNLLATPVTLLTPVPVKIVVDSAIASSPIPGFLRAVVPASFTQSKTDIVVLAVVLLMAVALLDQLQGLGSTLLRAYTGERLVMGFRSRLFRHAQRLSISYHDRQGTWDSVYRIQYDTAAIQNVSIDGVIPFLTATFKLVAMLWVITRIDWSLALVAMTISPILFLLSRTYRPRLRRQSREVRSLESSALSVVQEALSVVRVVKAFGREDQEEERYVQRATEGIRARVMLALAEGQYGLMVGLTSAVGTAAVLWIGVRHVQSGALSVGTLLVVLSYLGNLYGPLKTIGKQAASLQGNLASAERAFSVFDQAPDVAEAPHPRPLERAEGAVEFQNVSFSYAEGAPVLHDVALAVPAGARVGIAGRTGAGKTTLISLLTRFYDPSGGRILLDGIDLREYKLADLRNQFALVLQEPVLFSSSIAENIAYARPEASQEEIERAARLADAHDFITALPDGYETRVGERGMMLSGGERQRISLARAFLKDAPILLLDEPTSSVDTKTEAAIMEAMERLMHGRTSFIIAHRTSTLENCDVRMELEQGRIVSLKGTAPAVRE
jgi:ATP-binding cassette subfamily B protein